MCVCRSTVGMCVCVFVLLLHCVKECVLCEKRLILALESWDDVTADVIL